MAKGLNVAGCKEVVVVLQLLVPVSNLVDGICRAYVWLHKVVPLKQWHVLNPCLLSEKRRPQKSSVVASLELSPEALAVVGTLCVLLIL